MKSYQLYQEKANLVAREKLFKVNPFIDKNAIIPVRCNLIRSANCGFTVPHVSWNTKPSVSQGHQQAVDFFRHCQENFC